MRRSWRHTPAAHASAWRIALIGTVVGFGTTGLGELLLRAAA